jgi:hypothetical protein
LQSSNVATNATPDSHRKSLQTLNQKENNRNTHRSASRVKTDKLTDKIVNDSKSDEKGKEEDEDDVNLDETSVDESFKHDESSNDTIIDSNDGSNDNSTSTISRAPPVGISVDDLLSDETENSLFKSTFQPKRDFICPFCDARISRICDHKIHMESHLDLLAVRDKEGRFKCKHCAKTLKNPIILHKHIRLQVGETECKVCREGVVSKCQLFRHRNTHKRERSEMVRRKMKKRFCKTCNTKIPGLSILEFAQHLKNHESESKSK